MQWQKDKHTGHSNTKQTEQHNLVLCDRKKTKNKHKLTRTYKYVANCMCCVCVFVLKACTMHIKIHMHTHQNTKHTFPRSRVISLCYRFIFSLSLPSAA